MSIRGNKRLNFDGITVSLLKVNSFKTNSGLFTVPYFSYFFRCRSFSSKGRHLGLLMRTKLGRLQNGGGYRSLLTPTPLPTGTLYSPRFRSHQETK